MQNARLDNAQAGINMNNLRYTDNISLMAESEELKAPLDESAKGE